MEASVLIKFFAAAAVGYIVLLATLSGTIPVSVSALGVIITWAISKQIEI
jgi:hypothetical protein